MRYEWRIFYVAGEYDLWKRLKKSDTRSESMINGIEQKSRFDYYLDVQKPEFGLKERWDRKKGDYQPKLELKICLEELGDSGIEKWVKCVRIAIPTTTDSASGLGRKDLISFLEDAKNDPESKFHDKIDEVKTLLEKKIFRRIRIDKKRKQIIARCDLQHKHWKFVNPEDSKIRLEDDPLTVMVEQTDIECKDPENHNLGAFRTICIEGIYTENIKEFIIKFIDTGKGQVKGYPAFVMELG